MRAVCKVIFEQGQDTYASQLDYDTAVLSATVVFMSHYYEDVFSGLDSVLAAYNKQVQAEIKAKDD